MQDFDIGEEAAKLIDARLRRLSCEGKARHSTIEVAEAEAARITLATGEPMDWYKCKFCEFWHVGHDQNRPTPKRQIKLLLQQTHTKFKVLAWAGDAAAGRDVKNKRAKVKPQGYWPTDCADAIMDGAEIFGSKGARSIVGPLRPFGPDDVEEDWIFL